MGQDGEPGQLAASPAGLLTSEASSSPPKTSRPTTESSDEEDRLRYEREDERQGDGEETEVEDMPADPLLRRGRGEEVYELRERARKRRPGRLDLESAHYRGALGNDADEEDVVVVAGDDVEAIAYTAVEERAVVRKFDRRLVLFVALLYMLSFLDRSNIGNAFVAGMNEDLLQATDPMGVKVGGGPDGYYEWALTAFYIAYIAFEWLSLLWTVIPAHVYVSGIVLSWGVVASLQAVAGSYPWLITLRFLLGIGEAGFTGIPIYLSFFFRREELALRTAVFISAAPLATTFASSLAWLILKLGESGPIAPWRLLFLLEGFPAVVVATLAWRIIPDSPERASYLSAREKLIAQQRLLPAGREHLVPKPPRSASSSDDVGDDDDDSVRPAFLAGYAARARAVLLDPAAWAMAAIFFLTNMAYASLPVFLPAILTQMGHDPVVAQALAAPPHLVSFLVVLAAARASDALRSRARPIAAAALCSSLGYAFLALGRGLAGAGGPGERLNMARYLAVYPAGAGFFVVVVLTISWNVNNAWRAARGGGHGGGGAFALMQAVGQCGPVVGVRLYPEADGPWFVRGMGVCAAAMLGVAALALGLRAYLARENRRMDETAGDGEEGQGLVGRRGAARSGEGDDGFRYML